MTGTASDEDVRYLKLQYLSMLLLQVPDLLGADATEHHQRRKYLNLKASRLAFVARRDSAPSARAARLAGRNTKPLRFPQFHSQIFHFCAEICIDTAEATV